MASDETPQALAARLNSLRDEVKLQEEFNKLTAEAKQTLIEEGSLKRVHLDTLLLIQEAEKQNLGYAQRRFDATEKEIEKLKEAKDLDKSRYAQTVLQQEINKANATLRQQEIDLIEKQIKAGNIENIGRLKNLKKLDKQLKGLSKYSGKMGLMSGDSKQFTSSLKEIGGSMEQNLLAPMQKAVTGATSLKAGLQASVALLLVTELINFYKRAVKLAYELGNIENAFMKATGASEEFSRSISETYREGRRFAATAEDMSKAFQALFNTFTDFTFQDKDTRDSLIKTSAVLEKLGISNDKFAQSVQLSTKALGMSAEQAGQSMLDLEKYAEELGVSPERLSAQFLEAGDSLAKLGENGDEAFRDLAAASKITSLEVSKLLNIVNQFDTFEGAARQAGKLNAALGGNFVNAMDLMMETDPTARFEQIRDSILDTGLSFDTMSYYQKNFYKDALGLANVGELALVLSGNMDSVSGATKKTSQQFEEAAARAATVATFQEQLNILFAEMIPIITPLIDGMRSMFGWLSKNAKIIKVVTGVLSILGGVILGITTGWTGVGAAGAAAGITLGFSMLFDTVETGKDGVSGLSELFAGIGDAFSFVLSILKPAWEVFSAMFGLMASFLPEGEAMGKVFRWIGRIIGGVLVSAFIALLTPIGVVTFLVGSLIDAITSLGFWLFEKSFASTFLEGLVKVADAFGFIAVNIIGAFNPITQITKLIDALGTTFNPMITGITGMFAALSSPDVAANIMKIGEAIAAIPTRKNLEFVASMGGAAIAATAASAAPSAAAAASAATAARGGGTTINQGPETLTSYLVVGGEVFATAVQQVNGKAASNGLAGR